jgi:uncharacterized protein YwgA
MDSTLIALKLLLDGVRVATDVSTLDDRKAVQKAVYLGQRAGLDLGYRFGWYVMGPYSPDLARDYFELDRQLRGGMHDHESRRLSSGAQAALDRIAPDMNAPAGTELSRPDWLELLASLDYLLFLSHLPMDKAVELISAEKPHLTSAINAASAALKRSGLQPA